MILVINLIVIEYNSKRVIFSERINEGVEGIASFAMDRY